MEQKNVIEDKEVKPYISNYTYATPDYIITTSGKKIENVFGELPADSTLSSEEVKKYVIRAIKNVDARISSLTLLFADGTEVKIDHHHVDSPGSVIVQDKRFYCVWPLEKTFMNPELQVVRIIKYDKRYWINVPVYVYSDHYRNYSKAYHPEYSEFLLPTTFPISDWRKLDKEPWLEVHPHIPPEHVTRILTTKNNTVFVDVTSPHKTFRTSIKKNPKKRRITYRNVPFVEGLFDVTLPLTRFKEENILDVMSINELPKHVRIRERKRFCSNPRRMPQKIIHDASMIEMPVEIENRLYWMSFMTGRFSLVFHENGQRKEIEIEQEPLLHEAVRIILEEDDPLQKIMNLQAFL